MGSIVSNMEKQLAPGHVGSQVLAIGSAATRTTELAEGLYLIAPTVDCWFKQGDSAVAAVEATAGSHFLAAGSVRDVSVNGKTGQHISVIEHDSSTGHASVSELK